jgi:hypothetical protein
LERAPHFLQVGDAPIFVGDSTNELACRCGASVLACGLRPGTLLAIDIECAACGAITTTPGLGADQVVPFGVRTAERNRMTVEQPITLAPGVTLGDRDELARVDRLSAPRDLPAAPFDISDATLAAAAAEYDRLSGGQLAAHRRAVPPNIGDPMGDPNAGDAVGGLARLPLAWALGQLAPGVATEGWKCLAEDPDTVAAVQLGAFREFSQVWSQHPLFPAMAASAAASGFSTHSLAVFAAARCMVKDGNRIGFTPPGGGIAVAPPGGGGRIDRFHIETSPTERIPVHVRRFDGFDWPRGSGANAAATRAAAIDALIAAQGRINARQPGFLVLSVGAVHRQVDQALVDGMNQTMGERGRRQRGLAGVMLLLPKIVPTARSDQAVFSWMFLPFANPHFAHGKVALGMSRDEVMRASPFG